MAKSIKRYFRDGKELTHDEWTELFEQDLAVEEELSMWGSIREFIMEDVARGKACELNDHIYTQQIDCESADERKELA